ncbi:MAG: PQQ-binding-like beta-propeller repeat protein [Treponema sp.]|jgi:outer membrane protein assembly factor BamB|nr:PQQ-binding-like beta-propeller repeat protein [Treponema sp.]
MVESSAFVGFFAPQSAAKTCKCSRLPKVRLILTLALILPGISLAAQTEVSPLWRMALGGAVISPPSVQAGAAVVLMDSGDVKALSIQGATLWTYSSRGRVSPYLNRSPEGISYFSRTNGVFIAVNRVGRELWRRNLGLPLSGPVVFGWDGRIFVPAGNRIFCLTISGRLLWQRNLGVNIALTPVPDHDGGIMLVLEDATLLRIGPYGQTVSLYLSALPKVILPLGPGGEGGRVLMFYPNGGVEFADFRSPDFNRGPLPLPRLEGSPLAAAGRGLRAALLLEGGRLLMLHGLRGETTWSTDSYVQPGIQEQPALLYDERGIYVLSGSGASGFTEDGRLVWNLDLKGTASTPSFGDDGILYSGGADWIFYAFKLEDRVRHVPQSMFGPKPEGDYGLGAPPPSSWTNNPMRWQEPLLEIQLSTIRRDLTEGRVGVQELEYIAYLMEIAGSGQNPEHSHYSPLVPVRWRVESLQLLALIGSREIVPFLARIFREDPDPVVKTAAAQAIGAIGADYDGAALSAFFDQVFSINFREEQVMIAVISATGALCRYSGPPLSDLGIRILSSLSSPIRPNYVRNFARQELETLGK